MRRPIPPLTLAAVLLAAVPAGASPDAALDALYDAGTTMTGLKADVSLETLSGDSAGTGDDAQTKTGTFVLQRLPGGDSRVRVTFDKTQTGNKIDRKKEEFLVQNNTLTQRDGAMQKQTGRNLGRAGGKLDLFSLDGPFPLPIGQKPADVNRDFVVTELPANDPTALARLRLVPRDKTPLADKFKDITVLVDRRTRLPRQIVTNATNGDTKTTTLTNVTLDPPLADKDFDLGPLPDGWKVVPAN